jgi:glycosyltransferase involved in cell wall biosynthesis
VKICLTYPFYLPYIGGIELHISELAKYLAGRGHEVCIFTSMMKKDLFKTDYAVKFNAPQKQFETEYDNNIIIRRFNPNIYLPRGKPATLQFLYEYSENLRRFKEKNHFDIIHWHNIEMSAIGLLMGINSRTNNILTLHGVSYPVNDPLFYKRAFVKSILRKFDGIICISRESQIDALQYGVEKNKFHHIPNWVDTDLLKPVDKQDPPDGVKYVLYVGRMVKAKGVDVLIVTLSDLLKQGAKVRGLLVGDGPDLPYFINLAKQLGIEKNVIFTGNVPAEKKILYYSMADVFVLLSIHEPQGRVLLEAMSAGVPVVAFKSSGVAEIVPPDVGILLEDRSAIVAKEAILQLLSDERKTKKMRENARKFVVQNYSTRVVLPRIEKIYDSVRNRGFRN